MCIVGENKHVSGMRIVSASTVLYTLMFYGYTSLSDYCFVKWYCDR